jgi:hypothetical protein
MDLGNSILLPYNQIHRPRLISLALASNTFPNTSKQQIQLTLLLKKKKKDATLNQFKKE